MELLDVVNEHDEVIGQATREECHREGKLHRAVHLLLVNDDGEFYIHRRAAHLPLWPGKWTSSASGHVDAGETYDQAALRELKEELGVDGKPRRELKFLYDGDEERLFVTLYSVPHGGPVTPDPGEIAEGKWVDLYDLIAWVGEKPEEFTPTFREAFERYLRC
ncbi:MAG TPA: NUDIX domain-containing protein [Candidatus Thermoplasmatota archaeon]|nr:NUDIX domain-containing protein [Candidatus Thermoplasmatota archaeon]